MAMSKRERLIMNLLLLAAGAWVLDQFVVAAYLEKRQELTAEYQSQTREIEQANATIKRQGELRDLVLTMGDSLGADSSVVEARLLHLAQDWEQKANVTNASFQRVSAHEENGFTRLTFEISADGSMQAVAGFVYQIEKAAIPLRVDAIAIQPKNDPGTILDVHVTVSTICHGDVRASTRPVVADANNPGGRG
jgi:Tfp pilus assembly protein PilO